MTKLNIGKKIFSAWYDICMSVTAWFIFFGLQIKNPTKEDKLWVRVFLEGMITRVTLYQKLSTDGRDISYGFISEIGDALDRADEKYKKERE